MSLERKVTPQKKDLAHDPKINALPMIWPSGGETLKHSQQLIIDRN